MAAGRVEDFLRTEKEAQELVNVLGQLRDEVESYASARDALDVIAGNLRDLAARLTEVAEGFLAAVEALRAIGTPELLEGQEALAAHVQALRDSVEGVRRDLDGLTSQMLAAQEEHAAGIAETVARESAAVRENIDRIRQEDLALQLQALAALRTEIAKQMAVASASFRQLRNLVLGGLGGLVAVLALLIWLVVTNARG